MSMPDAKAMTAPVLRRRVFYIPGFDPAPPRRYRELYRKEAQMQAATSGYAIEVGGRRAKGSFGWNVTAIMDGQEVRSEFEVLVWSDIVRTSMDRGIISTYLQLARTAWIYISTGALFRLARLRKGPVIAALYPIVVLLAELLVAVLAGVGLGLLTSFALPAAAGWIIGVVAVGLLLRAFRRLDGYVFAYYLMQDYAFTAQLRGAYPPELEARLAAFGAVIAEALQGDCDEVLVVGHSSGAHLAVSILADLLRQGNARVRLGFLSLGQVVPMVSFLPEAHRLRADLHFLSTSDGLAWVDVTAPGDGCAFALCDPVAVSGVASKDKRWPLVISAAFTQTLSPARWKALRWRFFRLHFQYLCAFDRPGEYDYFRITAGPQTLATRFAGRAASKSRIETPVSRYTSRAA
jgi:hypothetical protein